LCVFLVRNELSKHHKIAQISLASQSFFSVAYRGGARKASKVICSSCNYFEPSDSKPGSMSNDLFTIAKCRNVARKELNLQSSVDEKRRSPLRNVNSYARLIQPIFKMCLRFHCDLLNKLPQDKQSCFAK